MNGKHELKAVSPRAHARGAERLVQLGRQLGGWQRHTVAASNAPFRDRVVHHAVMAPLEPWLDCRFIAHSYACRPGKGAHRAVDY